MTEVITYETLYELLRKEKFNQDIQEIDPEFFKKVITYLKEKEQLISKSSPTSTFSKEITTAKKQVENAKRLIKELYERRENKIVQAALLSSRLQTNQSINLLPEEQQLYQSVHETLTKYRQDILHNMLNTKQPEIKQEPPKTIKTEKKEPKNKLVRFIHPTPKFVDPNLKTYGPFEKEELSYLPQKIAVTLIKKNRAEEIKSEEK